MDSQTSKTPKAAKIVAKAGNSPTGKTQLVKIDILTKNGARLKEDLTVKVLVELWKSLETDSEVDGCSSHRKAGGAIRAHFFLKSPVTLGELYPEPDFSFEKTNQFTQTTDSFQCRIVGLEEIRPPKPGEIITACITRTNFSVPLPIIEQWIEKFGEIVTKPR